MSRKLSRAYLSIAVAVCVGAVLAAAFWPRALLVDIGDVAVAPMVVTIDEEGRTRVHDAYIVATPVAGRLLRVEVEPGDPVVRAETVVAQMLPANPAALDVRTREQARAAVAAAEAAVRLARAELNRAVADRDLADNDLQRTRQLQLTGALGEAALDRANRELRAAQASFDTAEAAIAMRQAELANARAMLMSFDESTADTPGFSTLEIPIRAPIDGHVLRVMQQSETTLPAGTPILEIGNIDNDLEVVAELLSTDAVQVRPGARVLIEQWGGPDPLPAVVQRVDPWGFTKFSALGVEEQRVNTLIRFADPQPRTAGLGHGFRVEARIVIWENPQALTVPSSALFRDGEGWGVFVVEDGRARRRRIDIGQRNATQAQVLAGVQSGDAVILFPPAGLEDRMRVARRTIR